MSDIHEDAKYKDLKSRLDDVIREFSGFVNDWADNNSEDPREEQSLMVTGWICGIMVTAIDSTDEYDDILYESSEGLNSFTAVGIATVQSKYYRDVAMGKYFGDEEDD